MKSIVCNEPGKMEMIETEDIREVESKEVLVQVKRIGICGTDIHAFGGNQPFFTYPRILGHELSGVVETVGEEVSNVTRGDKVAVLPYLHCGECISCREGKTNCCTQMKVIGVHQDGGMAEYIKVPAEHVFAVNELTLDEASIVEPLSIGAHAVKRASIKEGETVLIIGTGPIGLGAARFSKLAGAKTIVMDLSEERLQFGKEWAESDVAIQAGEQAYQQLLEENNGELPSVVLDATGNKHSMMSSLDYVAHGGKLVYVGLVKDDISFYDPDFHSKELTLLASRNALKSDFEYVISSMKEGLIKKSFISNKIPFEQTPSFFEANDFRANKTVIELGS